MTILKSFLPALEYSCCLVFFFPLNLPWSMSFFPNVLVSESSPLMSSALTFRHTVPVFLSPLPDHLCGAAHPCRGVFPSSPANKDRFLPGCRLLFLTGRVSTPREAFFPSGALSVIINFANSPFCACDERTRDLGLRDKIWPKGPYHGSLSSL